MLTTSPRVDLQPGSPPMLRADAPTDPTGWVAENADTLRDAVLRHGSLLVRGLGLATPTQVGEVFSRLGSGLMIEREAFAARVSYAEGVYSSSAWPPNQPMCMHHELSYGLEFPGLMMFACLRAPDRGGETAVADAAAVLEALPGDLIQRFEHEGWLLTRAYHDDIGASWTDSFGTEDPAEVERYCLRNGIEFEWRADGGLRTRQLRNPVMGHPVTGHACWFNQIAFLNEWTMAPEVREYLIELYGVDGLPFNTLFGGGERIDEDVISLIGAVYQAHTVREPWNDGDLLLVDNIRCAHSREAFSGPREVLVGMTDALRLDLAPDRGTYR